MLWKCCAQYTSKFRKLSSGHRTGSQFSFQSQRNAMPKNLQTTAQLHLCQFSSVQLLSRVWLFATPWTAACQASLSITNSQHLLKLMSTKLVMPSNHLILCHHTLAKQCSKFSKPGFNSIWTMDFQMFKLDLWKAEEPKIKLPTSAGS